MADEIEIPSPGPGGTTTLSPGPTATSAPNHVEKWLNSAFLGGLDQNSAHHIIISVRDFVNYTRKQTHRTAYFTEAMVEWSLEILRRNHNLNTSSDTCIANTYMCAILYRIGVGINKDGCLAGRDPQENTEIEDSDAEDEDDEPRKRATRPDDFRTLQEEYADTYSAFDGKRFIILPVNNGYAQAGEAFEHSKSVSKNDRTRFQQKSMPRYGDHWSLIIVDTTEKTARYIDSMVDVIERDNGKDKIEGINMNGPIAGKVLCGLDNLMGFKKGVFATSTLKYTPHQFDDNACQDDVGACGPFVYAFVNYILTNHQDVLHPNLITSFRKERKAHHLRLLAFDSERVRQEIQNVMWELRQNEESSDNSLNPTNIGPSNIASVLNVPALRWFLKPSTLRSLLDRFHDRDPDDFHDQDSDDAYLSPNNDDDDSDDDNDDEEWRKEQQAMINSFNTEKARKDAEAKKAAEQKAANDKAAAEATAEAARRGAAQGKTEKPDGTSGSMNPTIKGGTILKKGEKRRARDDDDRDDDHEERQEPLATQVIQGIPKGITELPNFARLEWDDILIWKDLSSELFDDPQRRDTSTTTRSLLHKKFKHTFSRESDKDLEEKWLLDGAVFVKTEMDRTTKLSAEQIKQRMVAHYEPERAAWADKFDPKKKKPTKRPRINKGD